MRSEPVYRRRRAVAMLILGAALSAAGWLIHTAGQEATAHPKPGDPIRLVMAATKTDALIAPVSMGEGMSLAPPRDPKQVGWWQQGPRPGESGAVVLTGHSVHNGGGVFDDLEDVRPGETVDVVMDSGKVTYRVRRVEIVDQEMLAEMAEELFGREGPSRLTLVTCEGWSGDSFDANVVVVATPVG